MHDAYQEHLLNASDVCQNCLRRVRVERVDPVRTGMGVEYETHMTRHDRHTEIDWGPAESVTEQQGTFCTHCGTETAFDRLWGDVDFADPELPADAEKFRELCKNAMRALEAKGVSIDRHAFATAALANYDEHRPIDECLGYATEHAIVVGAMHQGTKRQPVRGD